jgi:hypothetical protein
MMRRLNERRNISRFSDFGSITKQCRQRDRAESTTAARKHFTPGEWERLISSAVMHGRSLFEVQFA